MSALGSLLDSQIKKPDCETASYEGIAYTIVQLFPFLCLCFDGAVAAGNFISVPRASSIQSRGCIPMKRILCSLIAVLCLSAMMYAKDESKGTPMIGTICNSKCVVPVRSAPTCDLQCTDKSGDAVLVQDDGKVMKIENASMVTPHMRKHVKVMAVPTEKEREQSLRIMEISSY